MERSHHHLSVGSFPKGEHPTAVDPGKRSESDLFGDYDLAQESTLWIESVQQVSVLPTGLAKEIQGILRVLMPIRQLPPRTRAMLTLLEVGMEEVR